MVLLMFTYIAPIYTSIWCRKGDPGHGTKTCKRRRRFFIYNVHSSISTLLSGATRVILVTAPELQEDGMVQLLFTISLLADVPQLGAKTILVTAPKLQEGKRYFTYQHEFISITCLSTGAARDPGHGTRIARGVPLPVYMNF